MAVANALTGCDDRPPEEQVADRALERRQALMDRDFDRAYQLLTPGYRANYSSAAYAERFGGAVKWTDAEVKGIQCPEPDVCNASVLISYIVNIPKFPERKGQRPIEEKWIRTDGSWWYLPDS